MQTKKIPHFLDLPPCYQIDVLCQAIKRQTPLISCYAWSILSSFRKYIRGTIPSFGQQSEAENMYYRIRFSFTLNQLQQCVLDLRDGKHDISPLKQCELIELVEDVLIACIDDCIWTKELQQEMDTLLATTTASP